MEFLDENNIFLEKSDDFRDPLIDYATDKRLSSSIRERLVKLNFTKPTPIQAVSIPIILERKDFVGVSKTGSGKTLAFLIPAMEYLQQIETISYQLYMPKMMVVSPTRELALQTYDVFKKFGMFECICIYGGSSRLTQYQFLKSKKPPVIIGTPGRIIDFLDEKTIHLEKCYYLDEADQMFDMGFYPQIKKIIDQCPSNDERQTLLFTATWQKKVQDLADPLLNPNRSLVSIGQLFAMSACSDIKQHLFLTNERDKRKLLEAILTEFEGFKILVFTNTKVRTETLSDWAKDLNLSYCEYIHGDVSQDRRERVIKNFNNGICKVIFATDVASRGLDINDINVVVNFDFPIEVKAYVHRIGRCGRNGKKGLSFTFVTDKIFDNHHTLNSLSKIVYESGNKMPENLKR